MTNSRADLQKQPNYINRVITSRERKRDPNLIEVLLVHELMIEGYRVPTQLLHQRSKNTGIVHPQMSMLRQEMRCQTPDNQIVIDAMG